MPARKALLLASILLISFTTARADTIITVWNSVVASGTLGSQSFTNSLVTFSSTIDLTEVLYNCSFPVSGEGCGAVNPAQNEYFIDDDWGANFYSVSMTVAGLGTYQGVSNDVVTFTYDPTDNSFQPGAICDDAYFLCLGPAGAGLIGDNCYGSLPFPNDCPVSAATSGGYLIITSEDLNSYQAGGGVTSSTPEPNPLLLIATGMLSFIPLLSRRRTRNSSSIST
jgi:hypothetical protein